MTTTAPELDDYKQIHDVLRIAPHRMVLALADFADRDRPRAEAFARYWKGYAGEVLAHHTIEDEIFFPRLIERVPVLRSHMARVDEDHHRLDELMDAATVATRRLAADATVAAAERTAAVLRELAGLMDDHLDFEDEDLVPLFGRHFTAAEYEDLHKAAIKAIGLGRQAAFTIPFVLHWSTDEQRDKAMATAPLPLKLLYRATRGGHARLTAQALGRAGQRDLEGALR